MGAIEIIIIVVLAGVAITGAVTDVLRQKIYDWLTYPALALGVLLHALGWGWGSVFASGVISSIMGAAFCTVVFGAFYAWGRGFGGGDVKLMAALGSVAGFVPALRIAMATTLLGALMALLFVFFGKQGREALAGIFRREGKERKSITVPYGIAIALGTLWSILMRFDILRLF